jgi:Raf kinase inhibitor-like YbhB/YbcL family protein
MSLRRHIALSVCVALFLASAALADDDWRSEKFTLTSREFKYGETLPISAIYNGIVAGTNVCSINGAPGGDESPELTWTNAPRHTRSFVVTLFDTTAGVTHWGMYNISPQTTSLPQNAGIADSAYGLQIVNVFSDQSYDGPCPPPDYPPNNHRYLFTVYALSQELDLYSPPNFPASALTLYRALVKEGREGHILGSANLLSYYSTTPQ